MMMAEAITAMIMTPILSDRPIAVKIESIEKTRLMRAICVTTLAMLLTVLPDWAMCSSSPSNFMKISLVAL